MNKNIKKYLFVCLGNMDRSPTADTVFREMAKKRGIEIKVESAGMDNAYKIFVMESYMKNSLVEDYSQNPKKIFSLNIPDMYERNDPELVAWLKEKLRAEFE